MIKNPFPRKRLDLLLVQIPNLREPSYLIGVASLKAFLSEKGHAVACFNPLAPLLRQDPKLRTPDLEYRFSNEMEEFNERPLQESAYLASLGALVEKINETRPRFLGFSLIYGNTRVSLHFAKEMKKRFPGLPIVLGGPGVKTKRANYREEIVADLVVHGDGEEALHEILSSSASDISGQWKFSVQGIEFLAEGKWARNPDRPFPKNLDGYPQPDYSDSADDPCAAHLMSAQPLSLGRGCPFRCRFCAVRNYGPNYRHYSLPACLDYLRRQVAAGKRHFFVHDPITNGNPGWLREFSRALIEANLGISWGGNIRLSKYLNETETLDLLFESGFRSMIIGLESASPSVLKHMRKFHEADVVEQIFARLAAAKKRHGLRVNLQLIVGYPNETEADFQMTMDFVLRHRETIDEIISCSAFLMIQNENDDLFEMTSKGEFGLNVETECNWASIHSTPAIRLDRMQRAEALFQSLALPHRMFYLDFLRDLPVEARAKPKVGVLSDAPAFAALSP